jgi:hypothetical protein
MFTQPQPSHHVPTLIPDRMLTLIDRARNTTHILLRTYCNIARSSRQAHSHAAISPNYTGFLHFPFSRFRHPGLPAEPTTSPEAFDSSQTVPAVNCGENAPGSQAGLNAPSLLSEVMAIHEGLRTGPGSPRKTYPDPPTAFLES